MYYIEHQQPEDFWFGKLWYYFIKRGSLKERRETKELTLMTWVEEKGVNDSDVTSEIWCLDQRLVQITKPRTISPAHTYIILIDCHQYHKVCFRRLAHTRLKLRQISIIPSFSWHIGGCASVRNVPLSPSRYVMYMPRFHCFLHSSGL